jgi:hypothetical protein
MGEMENLPTEGLAQKQLIRQLIREKTAVESACAKATADLERERTMLGETLQELEDGGECDLYPLFFFFNTFFKKTCAQRRH